jgi:hypothetical protein
MAVEVTWRNVAAGLVAALVILFMVINIATSSLEETATSFELSTGDDENEQAPKDSSGEKTGDHAKSLGKRAAGRLLRDIVELAARRELDAATFKEALEERRLEINLALVSETAQRRTVWLDWLERLLELLSLSTLFLLLGPLWVYHRLPAATDRRRVAARSVTHFMVATAVALVVANGVASMVVGIQQLQVGLAAFGSPRAAVTDAVIHYVVYSGDNEALSVADLLRRASTEVRRDPLAVLGILDRLWVGLQSIKDSTVLDWAKAGFALAAKLAALYGPLLALATLLVAYRVVVPVIKNVVTHPVRALEDPERGAIWPFLKEQLRVLWQELRAAVWMFFFIFGLVALSVGCVRLLIYPMVVVSIHTVLATFQLVLTGRGLPTAGLIVSTASLALFLLLVMGLTLLPIGMLLSKTHRVVRARIRRKRPFKSFSAYWKTVRTVLFGIMGATAAAAGGTVALYFAADALTGEPMWRVWLPSIFAPLTLAVVWALRVFHKLVEVARTDICEAPPARTAESTTAAEPGG